MKTPSLNVEEMKSANNRWRLKVMCNFCNHEKNTFSSYKYMLNIMDMFLNYVWVK